MFIEVSYVSMNNYMSSHNKILPEFSNEHTLRYLVKPDGRSGEFKMATASQLIDALSRGDFE